MILFQIDTDAFWVTLWFRKIKFGDFGFGKMGFGETGFSKMGFGEIGSNQLYSILLTIFSRLRSQHSSCCSAQFCETWQYDQWWILHVDTSLNPIERRRADGPRRLLSALVVWAAC